MKYEVIECIIVYKKKYSALNMKEYDAWNIKEYSA